jgi:ATP-dependent DNA helicase RecG
MRWTEEKVREVIRNGENSFVEFKEYPLKPEQLAKELVAFSNFKGGTLFLGITDDGKISGIEKSNLEEWVMNVVSNLIEPIVIPSYQELKIDSKIIAIIELELGSTKPYAIRKGPNRSYYIRTGSTCRLADREQLRRLFQTSGNLQGELLPVTKSSFNHLELLTVKNYFKEYRLFEAPQLDQEQEWITLLKNNEYMIETELNNNALTIAGCILFAEEPEKLLIQAGVSAVAYKGVEKDYDTFERVEIGAPLSPKGLIKECVLFFQRNLSQEIISKNMQRKRIWDIPEDVLRETLLNAVAHRDYTISSNIEASIFRDRVEITSPGTLPNSVTIERMKAGCRVSRNQIITQTLKDYRLIEHMGMGVRNKIINGMLRFNQKEPEFVVDEYQVKVILYK